MKSTDVCFHFFELASRGNRGEEIQSWADSGWYHETASLRHRHPSTSSFSLRLFLIIPSLMWVGNKEIIINKWRVNPAVTGRERTRGEVWVSTPPSCSLKDLVFKNEWAMLLSMKISGLFVHHSHDALVHVSPPWSHELNIKLIYQDKMCVWVCICMCVCVWEREGVCVCVCVWER